MPGPLPILCGGGCCCCPLPEALLGISPVCGLGTGKFMLAPSPWTLLGVCGVCGPVYFGGSSFIADEGVVGPPRGVVGPPCLLLSAG